MTGKPKPILFSSPMVRALIREAQHPGTGKTQTRRLMKPQPVPPEGFTGGVRCTYIEPYTYLEMFGSSRRIGGGPAIPTMRQSALRFSPGDLLWVRETWSPIPDALSECVGPEDMRFAASVGEAEWATTKWRPSIHLPKWASRLTLEVTAVKVERLQDISEEDAIAEGLIAQKGDGYGAGVGFKWEGMGYHAGTMSDWGRCFHSPAYGERRCSCKVGGPTPAQCAYRELWERINGGGAWDANPFVVAVSFRVHKANVDALLQEREGRAAA